MEEQIQVSMIDKKDELVIEKQTGRKLEQECIYSKKLLMLANLNSDNFNASISNQHLRSCEFCKNKYREIERDFKKIKNSVLELPRNYEYFSTLEKELKEITNLYFRKEKPISLTFKKNSIFKKFFNFIFKNIFLYQRRL